MHPEAETRILIIERSSSRAAGFISLLQNTALHVLLSLHNSGLENIGRTIADSNPQIIFLGIENDANAAAAALKTVMVFKGDASVIILCEENCSAIAFDLLSAGAVDYFLTSSNDPILLAKTIVCAVKNKETADELRLSNERYELVSKATNDMVWDWDLLNNRVFRSADGWDKVFGTAGSSESLLADSWWDRVHPDDREKSNAAIDNILRDPSIEFFEIECRMLKNNGEYATVVDRGYVVRTVKGEVTRLIGATQNITAKREEEEILKASEKRFRSIIEKSSEGLALINDDGEVLEMSPAGKQILGYRDEEEYISARRSFIYHEDAGKIDQLFSELLVVSGSVRNAEYRFQKRDGNYIWLESVFHNLLHDPAIRAVVIHFRDISGRKDFENVLRNSEENYRNLFNSNPSSIFIWDPENYSVIEVNEAAQKEYGYSKADFIGNGITNLFLPQDLSSIEGLAGRVRRNPELKSTDTKIHVTKTGEQKLVDITYRAINYYGKKAVLTIINNVTEKAELEKKLRFERRERLNELTGAVIKAQEQERESLGKELHDNINQILATTKLYIEYAQSNETKRTELLNAAKGFIESAVTEIRSLSKSLLPPSLGGTGLIPALNDLVKSLQPVSDFRIKTKWDLSAEACLPDSLKLTVFRIVQEQLNNISKHAHAKNVNIFLSNEDHTLSLIIEDDGVGFNPAQKNAGVGLKNILSRSYLHNGKLSINSSEGKGCALRVTFNTAQHHEKAADIRHN